MDSIAVLKDPIGRMEMKAAPIVVNKNFNQAGYQLFVCDAEAYKNACEGEALTIVILQKKCDKDVNLNRMKTIKKENLPVKICVVCSRPFTWRKKWEKVWEKIKYCSDQCRKNK